MASSWLLLPHWPLPSSPLLSRRWRPVQCSSSVRTLPSPASSQLPRSPLASFPTNPNPSTSPSLTCALQCQHFQSCSGCSHELNLHHPIILDEVADFFKNHGVSDFTFDSCRLWNWRCRAKLAVRGSSMDPLIGLYEEGTHNVVDIPHCKAHHPNINAAIELLKQGMADLNVEPYNEDYGTGQLRYVQMAVTTHNTSLPAPERYRNGKVQVSLVWNSRSENSQSAEKLNALADTIFGNKWQHLVGERDFREHVGGIDVSLAPSSFGQANTRAFDSLLQKLQKYVPLGASVTDLYAGAGVIGLSLAAARKCRSVKCVETNKESKQSFERIVERLPESVSGNISWHHADASIEPVSWLMGSDVVVVDPPRKGLDASLVNALRAISMLESKVKRSESSNIKTKVEKRPWILRAKVDSVIIESKVPLEECFALPETLIYVSCGWDSFKEDCKSLLSSRLWHLEKAHGYNFFPGTQSLEVLAVFKRRRGVKLKKKKLQMRKKKQL